MKKLIPIIYTLQIEETIDFYVNVLGFECKNKKTDIAWLSIGNVEMMVSLPNSHTVFSEPEFTGSFYFEVENTDEYWEKFKNTTNICYEIEDFDYGMREFGIYDNNGYLLQFGHQIG